MFISRHIISKLAPEGADVQDRETRARVGLFAGWASVCVNVALFLVKVALAVLTGSVSLVADAVHTLSDSMTSLVLIIGFRVSRKPADARHPYGHGRMENIAALVIGVILAVVAVEMAHRGCWRLMKPQPLKAKFWLLAVLGVSMGIKELLARFTVDLAAFINSGALQADAVHHRSDAVSTGLVIVAFIGARYDALWLDGVVALGVAVLIGWAAVKTLLQAVSPLLGEQPSDAMMRQIEQIALAFPLVEGVHEIMVHRYGPTHVISLHVETPAGDPIHMHEMIEALESKINCRFPGHAIVHVDPINLDHPHYAEVQGIVTEFLDGEGSVASFHDLRLIGGGDRFKAVFDIVPTRQICEDTAAELQERIRGRLRERFSGADVVIHVESPYFERPGGADTGEESCP